MQCLLNYRQALVRSGTRTCPRKSPVNFCHHRAITGAKLWAAERIVSCSSAVLEVVGDTQSSGGGRSNGPGQGKQTGGGGDPEGRSEAPGWWRLDGDVVRTLASILAIGVIYRGLVTKVELKESEGRVTKRVDEKVADVQKSLESVQKSVIESEGRVQKSVTESEGRVQKSLESVQKSVGTLHILVIVQAIVGAFVAGLSVSVLFAGKGKGSK